MDRKFIFLFIVVFAILICLNFVFPAHTSSPTSMTINQSQYYIFNITINNTNVGTTGNITQVNITLPSGFLFVTGSNGTYNATGDFTNTSTVLSWTNTTNYLINGTTNNTRFWFNATAQASLVPSGYYNISITSLNGTGAFQTNLSVKVNDITAPVISLITPTSGNATTQTSVVFSFNVTDDSTISNCSLILNGAPININNSGTNRSGGTTSFVNISYVVSNTWNINCTDIDNNMANSSTWSFSLLSFGFNGTTRDENGNLLNNSVINITIRSLQGFTVLAYTSVNSNASGWFNFSVSSNASWLYEPSIIHRNLTTTPNFVDFKSKTIPAFSQVMIEMLAGTTFYLSPAGTINITAINASGGRTVFQYQIKDQALGYPVAEDHTNWVSEINVFVPKNRNYSIMIYPNQSMPVSFNWNNFSSSVSYNLTGSGTNPSTNFSKYIFETSTLHKQFNISLTMTQVTGYVVNSSGTIMSNNTIGNWTNFTVIPFLLEPGNMVHSDYGDMPYNLSSAIGLTDLYNLTSGFFNISIPATTESSTVILFVSIVHNNSVYYGGFKNVSFSYGTLTNSTNITIFGLLGTASNITMDQLGGAAIPISTAKQSFNLVNATNSTLSSTSAHIETTVDYSSSAIGAMEFTWMSDVQQSASAATFSLPLLNITGIKEMNVYASGGPSGGNGQYAPKRISTQTAAQINANNNITLKLFNPEAIDASVAAASISMALYISNSSCDVPNPSLSCQLGGNLGDDMADFNPMKAVMGGGKISFRMGTGNILIHYVNVDMLASGPPDVLFDSAANTNGTSGSSFASALRFGSQGPTIYDYALISMPYVETAGSGLNDSAPVNVSIPLLYDDNWNIIWNTTSNGTASGALAGNYSHYSSRQSEWGNLTVSGGKLCSTANVTNIAQINSTDPCHIDNSSNRIWVRIPHFSGTGPSVSGSVVATSSSSSSSSSSGSGVSVGQNKTKSQVWAKITPGAATIMKNFDKDLGIKEISIEVNNPAQNVKITVTKYAGKPAEVSVEKSGKVYKYLQIDAKNLESNLSKAVVKIQVEKSWITSKGLNKTDIALFKFKDGNWQELTTTFSEEDITYYYYTIELTSFSYFAIGGKAAVGTPGETGETGETRNGGETTETTTGGEESKSKTWLWILIAVVILAVIIGGWLTIKNKK